MESFVSSLYCSITLLKIANASLFFFVSSLYCSITFLEIANASLFFSSLQVVQNNSVQCSHSDLNLQFAEKILVQWFTTQLQYITQIFWHFIMKLAESYAYFCTPYSSFCILTCTHKSKNHMTLLESSSIHFVRVSNKTKLLLCNLFFYAHAKLFLYKWKLISLLAVNVYPSIHQSIVPSILMICEKWSFFTHAVLPWTFSSVNTPPLNSLFIMNQLMDDDFPASFNT